MKSIALMSEKGGTGKTTSLLNLASGMARAGRKVLVVDADPQANATMVLTGGQGLGRHQAGDRDERDGCVCAAL